jgi:hypothetical protein
MIDFWIKKRARGVEGGGAISFNSVRLAKGHIWLQDDMLTSRDDLPLLGETTALGCLLGIEASNTILGKMT